MSDIKWGSIRVARFEITGLAKEDRKRWRELGDRCQEIANTIWETWLTWHVERNTRAGIAEFMAERKAWYDADNKTRGPKPKYAGEQGVSGELQKRIYAVVTERFPTIHTRVATLVISRIVGTMKTRKSTKGDISGLWAILLNRESVPSTTRGIPIPFDRGNSALVAPDNKDDNYGLSVRLERTPRPGKTSVSVAELVKMWTKGRKRQSQAAILKKCISGEYKFCGSSIVAKNGKLFANICWAKPAGADLVDLDHSKTAFLRPARNWPFRLQLPGRKRRPGGMGYMVAHVRRQITTQRWSRSANYRWSGSAAKGHGRNRAWGGNWKLQRRWNEFVKRYNNEITTDVVNQLVAGGIGRIVFYQPTDDRPFLATAGKIPDRKDASGWDWHQVKTQLQQKCERVGIEIVVRQKKSEAFADATG